MRDDDDEIEWIDDNVFFYGTKSTLTHFLIVRLIFLIYCLESI